MQAIHEEQYKDYTIKIYPDEMAQNPREMFDYAGRMYCFHSRYKLGDEHDHENPDDLKRYLAYEADPHVEDLIDYWENGKGHSRVYNFHGGDYAKIPGAVEERIQAAIDRVLEKHYIILPLYLYDHSMTSISTRSFIGRAHHAEWDSGQVGIMVMTKKQAHEEWGRGKKGIEGAIRCMKSEVEEYDNYLRGNVYGYEVYRNDPETCEDDPGDGIDSCWGFYGDYDGYVLEAAKEAVDSDIASRE